MIYSYVFHETHLLEQSMVWRDNEVAALSNTFYRTCRFAQLDQDKYVRQFLLVR